MNDKHASVLEEAIQLLAKIPYEHKVYITSGRPEALERFRRYIQKGGLVGVEVVEPITILKEPGFINKKGMLIISEPWELDERVRFGLYKSREYMNSRY